MTREDTAGLGDALISQSQEEGGVTWRGPDFAAIKPVLTALASLAYSWPRRVKHFFLGPKQR